MLWAVNPLMLFWLVDGAHTDLLAALPLMLALLAGRTLRQPGAGGRAAVAAGIAGALAGIAIAVKVTFAGPVAGLAAGLWQPVTGRRRNARPRLRSATAAPEGNSQLNAATGR